MKAAEPSFADSGFHFVSLCLRARYFRFSFWTPSNLILDTPCAEPLKPCLAQRRKDTKYFYYLSRSLHSGHPVRSFWTPVLHGVFSSPWRVALRRNRFPIPVMTSITHPNSHFGHRLPSFWTPVLHGVFSSPWRVALRRNRFPVPVMTEHNPPKQPFWTPHSDTLEYR